MDTLESHQQSQSRNLTNNINILIIILAKAIAEVQRKFYAIGLKEESIKLKIQCKMEPLTKKSTINEGIWEALKGI